MKIEFYNKPIENKERITYGDLCLGDIFEYNCKKEGIFRYFIKANELGKCGIDIETGDTYLFTDGAPVAKYNALIRFDKSKFVTEKKDL